MRYAEGQLERLEALATDLVSQNVDLIVATTPSTLAAARRATSTIPIVMVYGPDPAETGVVSSLARPGGNVTGLTSLSVDLSVKQLQLLRQIAPSRTRVAVLWNPGNPWHAIALERLRSTAGSNQIVAMPVRGPDDFDGAFASIAQQRADALLCLSDPMTFIYRRRLAELAIQGRLPNMHGVTAYAEAGGLASYWPNPDAMYRRAADYSHRILSGARPADLPVEQPRSFELVINLRTARALGIQVPSDVLTMAARTIE
jgi:putative ABC transport system substrate-binding protein